MPWLLCLCLMLCGYEGAEKLLELLHVKRACLQTRTQLIAVCFGSSYLQDSPQECQSTQQHREQKPQRDRLQIRDVQLFLSHLSHIGSSCLWNMAQEISENQSISPAMHIQDKPEENDTL